MAEDDGLLALQGLHSDLLAFSENRLQDIDRLVTELDSRIEEFRQLLDKKSKSETSRKKLGEGKIEIGDLEYTLNDDFKQQAIEVADELDLDEIEATTLLIQSQDEAADLDRSATAGAILRFHKRRQFLLECLRLVIKIAQDGDTGEDNPGVFQVLETKRKIVNVRGSQVANGAEYWSKCFDALQNIEAWLNRLAERQQRVSVIGHSLSEEALELLEFEGISLLQQHESLVIIASMLVKDNDGYTEVGSFKSLLARLRAFDKHDMITVHYLPLILAFVVRYGDSESTHCAPEDATAIHQIIMSAADKDNEHWSLRSLQAAVYVWWSAEYFSKYKTDSDAEKKEIDEMPRFSKALQEGAFHFMLSVASDIRTPDWYDPAKAGLISFLLQDTTVLAADVSKPAAHFQRLFMDQLQLFVDAFITNMPNILRNLKSEEDKQRRELLARFQKNTVEYQYHLERFLVLLSFAFEDSSDGALMFWEDPDGNLYGFLQWAAKRQTTPRVAAFCEMLAALSENEANSNAAHRFLLEEGSPIAGKLRRTGSLSWNQIYAEIFFYASTIRDRPAPVQSADYGSGAVQDVVEPESALMLECYLRLVAKLCRHSPQARTFVLEWQHENMTLRDILFQLASSQIDSRLRACAFTTLAAFLTDKNPAESDIMWIKLDQWIAGGSSPTSTQPARSTRTASSWSEHVIFETIASGFEEANAFLSLLNALIAPPHDSLGLNDSLPYPENLGSTYRSLGIDSYVDFVLGKAFAERTQALSDPAQIRLLRLGALDFAATCLSTFNEDLVVVANRTAFPVDSAMRTSSLEAYVCQHPFARVMEWLLNDKVLVALFATAHDDTNDVNAAAADSAFVLSLVRAVEVMNLIMKLQATYIDIVRPLVKSKASTRRPIAHSAIATFEDALTNNLQTVVDLGLYCGTGHQELTLASLSLLEKLSSSKKLVVSPAAGFGKFSDRSKLIGVYEQNDEAERVSRSLMAELRIDGRELEGRQVAPGYIIKSSILSFLKNCLLALPDRPTLAHLLLGFVCRVRELEIAQDGLIAQGSSLLHAIASLAVEYPEVGPVPQDKTVESPSEAPATHPQAGMPSYFAWLSNIRVACIEIMWILWKSPLSNALVMTELRSNDFIFALVMRQGIISPSTLWDGRTIRDPLFLHTDSAIGLRNFLRQRSAFFDYFARELRVAREQNMNGLIIRLRDTLLGHTKFPGQQPLPNPTIFDLFDFMEIDVPAGNTQPRWDTFADIDFEVCRFDGKGSNSPYDIASAQELMLLRRNEVLQTFSTAIVPMGSDDPIARRFESDFTAVLSHLNSQNQHHELLVVHAETLHYWSQLIVVAVTSCDFDDVTRTSFALQALQLVLPKLERALEGYSVNSLWTARTLLQLVQALMKHLGLSAKAAASSKTDFGSDRVFNVFRIALAGISADVVNAELRELCYDICYQYMKATVKDTKKGTVANRHILRSIKLAGERLLDVVCDDAYASDSKCRVTALLFLDATVLLSNIEESKYLLEGFLRLNFIGVLVDGLKSMPQDLASAEDIRSTLAPHRTSLTLLLRLATTRPGATALLNSGLFPAIRASTLFSTDPDIGLDIDNPAALSLFFSIVLAVLRIVVAVLLSRGNGAADGIGGGNEQMKQLIREFLSENRQGVVGTFKRAANIGGRSNAGANANGNGSEAKDEEVLSEIVDMYAVLISASGWMEHEDLSTSQSRRARLSVFS